MQLIKQRSVPLTQIGEKFAVPGSKYTGFNKVLDTKLTPRQIEWQSMLNYFKTELDNLQRTTSNELKQIEHCEGSSVSAEQIRKTCIESAFFAAMAWMLEDVNGYHGVCVLCTWRWVWTDLVTRHFCFRDWRS